MKGKKKYNLDNDLGIEELLVKYEPLRKSVFRIFSRYDNLWNSVDDFNDLRQQIDFEFMKLYREYDPNYGVDFPGYIKSHLQQRVYHYVTKLQNKRRREGTYFIARNAEGDPIEPIDFNNFSTEREDEKWKNEFRKIEARRFLNIEEIPEKFRSLVEGIMIQGKFIEEIAKEEGISVRKVKLRLNAACEYFISETGTSTKKTMKKKKEPFNYSDKKITRKAIILRIPIIVSKG